MMKKKLHNLLPRLRLIIRRKGRRSLKTKNEEFKQTRLKFIIMEDCISQNFSNVIISFKKSFCTQTKALCY